MNKIPIRDRSFASPDARTVACGCGTRLGILWTTPTFGQRSAPGWDGAWLNAAEVTEAFHDGGAILNIAHEDWISVRCKRCGRDWQGRAAYIHALLSGSAPAERVTLGAPVKPAPRSRSW